MLRQFVSTVEVNVGADKTLLPLADAKPKRSKDLSRPVQVVVRPYSLDLGFGNFKEQSQLKINWQIEAEEQGLELPEEDDEKLNGTGVFVGVGKSLLPDKGQTEQI